MAVVRGPESQIGRESDSAFPERAIRSMPASKSLSTQHKGLFSCFYTAGHKALLGRFRIQGQTTCLQNSCSAN
jgi:hypothetical protein